MLGQLVYHLQPKNLELPAGTHLEYRAQFKKGSFLSVQLRATKIIRNLEHLFCAESLRDPGLGKWLLPQKRGDLITAYKYSKCRSSEDGAARWCTGLFSAWCSERNKG